MVDVFQKQIVVAEKSSGRAGFWTTRFCHRAQTRFAFWKRLPSTITETITIRTALTCAVIDANELDWTDVADGQNGGVQRVWRKQSIPKGSPEAIPLVIWWYILCTCATTGKMFCSIMYTLFWPEKHFVFVPLKYPRWIDSTSIWIMRFYITTKFHVNALCAVRCIPIPRVDAATNRMHCWPTVITPHSLCNLYSRRFLCWRQMKDLFGFFGRIS